MSKGINSIHIVGHLGQDPELRHTGSGKAVCNLTVATKDRNNETTWHRAIAWEKTAQFADQYLKKGDLVYIEGRMEYRSYEKDGQTRSSAEIVCHTLQALGSKDRGSEGRTEAPKDHVDGNVKPDDGFDDIPF